MGRYLALVALFAGGAIGAVRAAEPDPQTDRCAFQMDAGGYQWSMDCEEIRHVRVRVLLAEDPEPDECDNGCDQKFLVQCEDYWSVQHLTDFAIVHYRVPTWNQRIPFTALPRTFEATTLILHRGLDCSDSSPAEAFGQWGGFWRDSDEAVHMSSHEDRRARLSAVECLARDRHRDDADCSEYCCFLYSYFFDVEDARPVPVESLRKYGELPCFRFVGNSSPFEPSFTGP